MTVPVMRLLLFLNYECWRGLVRPSHGCWFMRPVSNEQHRGYEYKRCTDDQDVDRIGQSHVCLLALTVRYYV